MGGVGDLPPTFGDQVKGHFFEAPGNRLFSLLRYNYILHTTYPFQKLFVTSNVQSNSSGSQGASGNVTSEGVG